MKRPMGSQVFPVKSLLCKSLTFIANIWTFILNNKVIVAIFSND